MNFMSFIEIRILGRNQKLAKCAFSKDISRYSNSAFSKTTALNFYQSKFVDGFELLHDFFCLEPIFWLKLRKNTYIISKSPTTFVIQNGSLSENHLSAGSITFAPIFLAEDIALRLRLLVIW